MVGAASQTQARDRRNGRPPRFFGCFVMVVDPRGEKFALCTTARQRWRTRLAYVIPTCEPSCLNLMYRRYKREGWRVLGPPRTAPWKTIRSGCFGSGLDPLITSEGIQYKSLLCCSLNLADYTDSVLFEAGNNIFP